MKLPARRLAMCLPGTVAAVAVLAALAAMPVRVAAAAATSAAPAPGAVEWRSAAVDADVDRAFAQARAQGKPVLLYWGAKWCPPCNQLKATLFNRQDFIERSKAVVAVYVDGDGAGAQKLGSRFKVRGYPTMILFAPDGSEVTRLPGEADAPQVIAMLDRAQAGGRPVKTVLADARAGKPLAPGEWRALAMYSWETDQEQLVPEGERPALLAQLAAGCPATEAESASRLLLRALAASDEARGLKADAAVRARVDRLLADAVATRAQMDSLVNFAPQIARALAPDDNSARRALVKRYDAALARLEADATLSRGDRMSALQGRVELARLGQGRDVRQPKLDAVLVKQVREHVARDDREIADAYERQAVITNGAYVLGLAGLWAESDALLKANLARSHSPYYLMSQLGGNARKLGRTDDALRWYAQAYETSEGPATRLQWGAGYFSALVELAPQDAARIERVAAQLFDEAARDPAAFYERSARSLQRVGSKLSGWAATGSHDAVVARLKTRLDAVCSKLPAGDPQRATCEGVIKGGGTRSAYREGGQRPAA